jgi:hypothetical protein
MDERQKIEWAQQDKKLLLLLEKQQALPTNHPFSMAKLGEEILAVEELVRSYQVLRATERLGVTCATGYRPWGPSSSVVTLKPAICGQFKTGHRDWPKT